jgi:cytochrome c
MTFRRIHGVFPAEANAGECRFSPADMQAIVTYLSSLPGA